MYLLHLLVLLLCVYESQHDQVHNRWKFNVPDQTPNTVTRLFQLMRSYYEEANSRLSQMNNIRFMYEESPYYEMGYIIGEIIESVVYEDLAQAPYILEHLLSVYYDQYRKVLEWVQRPVRFKFLKLPAVLKVVEVTQKLYFELYHLVRMMHETPRKWRHETEFKNIENEAGYEQVGRIKTEEELEMEKLNKIGLKELLSTQKNLQDMQKRRIKERRRQRKKLEKLRQAYMMGLMKDMRQKAKKYNKWWPLDYGWEIDYYW